MHTRSATISYPLRLHIKDAELAFGTNVQVQRGTNAQDDTILLYLFLYYLFLCVYIAAQWNNTYNMGYVARRTHLRFVCTTQLLCVITFAGMSVAKKC